MLTRSEARLLALLPTDAGIVVPPLGHYAGHLDALSYDSLQKTIHGAALGATVDGTALRGAWLGVMFCQIPAWAGKLAGGRSEGSGRLRIVLGRAPSGGGGDNSSPKLSHLFFAKTFKSFLCDGPLTRRAIKCS